MSEQENRPEEELEKNVEINQENENSSSNSQEVPEQNIENSSELVLEINPQESPKVSLDNLNNLNNSEEVNSANSENTAEESLDLEEDMENEKVEYPKANLKELPKISWEEAKDYLKSGKVLSGHRVPLLKLNEEIIKHPVTIQNCYVERLVAQGTIFQGNVLFENCVFSDKVEFSAFKSENGLVSSVFEGEIKVLHCLFESFFALRNAKVARTLFIKESSFRGALEFDRGNFGGSIVIQGPGEVAAIRGYRADVEDGVIIQNQKIGKIKDKSIHFNNLRAGKGLTISECEAKGSLELRRAQLGKETKRKAFALESSSFQEIDLSEAYFDEKVALEQVICRGAFMADAPKQDDGWRAGKSSCFSYDASFLEVHFEGKTSFSQASFRGKTNFRKCKFSSKVNFGQAEFHQRMSFWESEAEKGISFRKAHFMGVANFGNSILGPKSSFNEATFCEEASFFGAQAKGDIFFSEARFEKDLIFRQFQVDGGLGLSKVSIGNTLNLLRCKIQDRFIFSDAQVEGEVFGPTLSVGTWGTLSKSIFKDKVNLRGLQVGRKVKEKEKEQADSEIVEGSFYVTEATFQKELIMTSAVITGDFCFDSINSYSEVNLQSIFAGGKMDLSNSYFRGMVHLDNASCKNKFQSFKTRYKEEVSFNSVKCPDLSFSNSSFDGGFTLRSAEIEGNLVLNDVDVDGKADLGKCQFEKIYFVNFLADNFIIHQEQIGEKLSSEEKGNFSQARIEYGILRQAFQKQCFYQEMDWAYYRFCRTGRLAKNNFWDKPGAFLDKLLLDWGFGYGTRPMNIGGVAFAIVMSFASLFYFFPQGITGSDGQPLEKLVFLDSIYLSVVTFASMDYGDCGPYFGHWLKYFFSAEGLVGIFLITLFVATISRKIIRT